jgi:branched-chain amino acid transport system ATP-binding protein
MLKIENLSASYGTTEVLHGISLEVKAGHITTLIGGNGAGKTTLMNTIMGLVPQISGSILLRDEEIAGMCAMEIVKRGVTLIPEGRHIFPQMTVYENLDVGAYARTDKAAVSDDLAWALELFPLLKERLNQQAGTLSGGEQQMLAFGRALMAGASLIMMDEPSMGLAPIIVENIFETIGEIRKMGKTVLLVEQNAALALEIADEAYVLELGHIVLSGSGQSLAKDPKVESAYLGL